MTNRYCLFLDDGRYTDEEGAACSMDEHLAYLRKWGGTPDMWCGHDDFDVAVEEARTWAPKVVVMTDDEYNPILTLNVEEPL